MIVIDKAILHILDFNTGMTAFSDELLEASVILGHDELAIVADTLLTVGINLALRFSDVWEAEAN